MSQRAADMANLIVHLERPPAAVEATITVANSATQHWEKSGGEVRGVEIKDEVREVW